jgi:hypothetical protein
MEKMLDDDKWENPVNYFAYNPRQQGAWLKDR